jgi:glycoside/pentoside/hexuronide:cation symporter, GPH family
MQTETIEYSQNIESTGSNQKLKFKEKFSYGLGNLSANLLITTANTFITFYYTEVAGIAIAIVGTLLLFARIGASDLVMGVVVDKTRTKHGKGRPWLLWLAIPYGLAIILSLVLRILV